MKIPIPFKLAPIPDEDAVPGIVIHDDCIEIDERIAAGLTVALTWTTPGGRIEAGIEGVAEPIIEVSLPLLEAAAAKLNIDPDVAWFWHGDGTYGGISDDEDEDDEVNDGRDPIPEA
jgi:hypothetical protein